MSKRASSSTSHAAVKKPRAKKQKTAAIVSDSYLDFQHTCAQIQGESAHSGKQAIVEARLASAVAELRTAGGGAGAAAAATMTTRRRSTAADAAETAIEQLVRWCRLLLPKHAKRVYNCADKALIKVFASIFSVDGDALTAAMHDGPNAGEISLVLGAAFAATGKTKHTSSYTLREVDAVLDTLVPASHHADFETIFTAFLARATEDDLVYLIRLVKHDLRTKIGPKYVLGGLDSTGRAYAAYVVATDLDKTVRLMVTLPPLVVAAPAVTAAPAATVAATTTVAATITAPATAPAAPTAFDLATIQGDPPGLGIQLGVPCKPQLAKPVKSYADVMKECPNGVVAEIKYDGERLTVHKDGTKFSYFARSLRECKPNKTEHIAQFLPQAFPNAQSLVLDCEILMQNTKTDLFEPFGSLGVHKRAQFADAVPCLVVFDLLYYNGKSLLQQPFAMRRRMLEHLCAEVKHRVILSEKHAITCADDVEVLMKRCMSDGLEGIVLKRLDQPYGPNKRWFLKMKKDYLANAGTSMADSADLLVLGGYFGTGKHGGQLSRFLMGVHDAATNTYKTVCVMGNGFDDARIDSLQGELLSNMSHVNGGVVPAWLDVVSKHIPDYVTDDARKSPVWEVRGAQFSLSKSHTATGVSIRFPRVVRERDDKSHDEATTLKQLRALARLSAISDSGLLAALGTTAVSASANASASASASASAGGSASSLASASAAAASARQSCRYGTACYRKRTEHFAAYAHPGDGDYV